MSIGLCSAISAIDKPQTASKWASAASQAARSRRAAAQIHAHARFLLALACKNENGGRLGNLCGSLGRLLATTAARFSACSDVAGEHAGVTELRGKLISGQGHTHKTNAASGGRRH